MIINKSRNFLISIILLTAIALIGCSSDTSNTSNSVDNSENDVRSELNVAFSAEPNTLDPLVSTSRLTNYINDAIFEPLVTRDENAKPTLVLADSLESSDDNRTHTFHLRENIKFHNGEEMTSEDVVASMERWAGMSKKAKQLFPEISFEAVDKYTVVMEIDEFKNDIWDVLIDASQYGAIMPKEIAENADEKGVKEYIGTGPYVFVEHKQGQHIHIKKNEEYQALDTPTNGHGGEKVATIDDMYFHFVTDPSTRVAGIQSGQYDIAIQIPLVMYEELESNPEINTHTSLDGDLMFFYNKKQGLLTDVKMRKAIHTAVNHKEILDAVYSSEDLYTIHPGYMNPEVEQWHTEAGKEAHNQHDIEKAKKLLEEANYDGEEIEIIAAKDHPQFYDAAVVLQEQLKNIGMNVTLTNYDWATYLNKIESPDNFDIAVSGAAYLTTPSQLLVINSNFAGWSEHPKIDELLDKMRSAEDEDESFKYWEELQEFLLVDYVPATQVGGYASLTITSKKIETFNSYPSPIMPTFWDIRLKE